MRFPVVIGAAVAVAIALAVKSYFETMALSEKRAFVLGQESILQTSGRALREAPKVESSERIRTPSAPSPDSLTGASFSEYVRSQAQ